MEAIKEFRSLKGTTYKSNRSKRTEPRDHAKDLAAREHYQTRAIRRPRQIWEPRNNGLAFTPRKVGR